MVLADADRSLGVPLARAGFDVRVVASLVEARDRLGAASDLAVLDTSLFEGDAASVIRALRERGVAIPLLLLAGHASDVAPALDAGADDVVVRPFAVIELVARCRALVRRARAPRWTPTR